MPYQQDHPACWIPPLLPKKEPDVKTSRSKEERHAREARACTPPDKVQGDCERRRPGL